MTRLVDHLRRQEDLDLRRWGGPDEWCERRCDPLLAVEEQAVRPQGRLAIHVFGVEPVLAIEREIEVADGPLLRLPPPVQVHVAGHVLDAAVDEGEDIVDPDVAELLEVRPGDPLKVRVQLLTFSINRHGAAGPLDQKLAAKA